MLLGYDHYVTIFKWALFVALYAISTIFAIIMTFREQKRRGPRTPVPALIVYLLCTVWPLVVAIIVFYSLLPEPGDYPPERS